MKNQQCLVCMPLKKVEENLTVRSLHKKYTFKKKSIYVVYMRVAEVYFGRMSRHNHFHHWSIEPTIQVSGIKVIVLRLCSDFWNRSHMDDLV